MIEEMVADARAASLMLECRCSGPEAVYDRAGRIIVDGMVVRVHGCTDTRAVVRAGTLMLLTPTGMDMLPWLGVDRWCRVRHVEVVG